MDSGKGTCCCDIRKDIVEVVEGSDGVGVGDHLIKAGHEISLRQVEDPPREIIGDWFVDQLLVPVWRAPTVGGWRSWWCCPMRLVPDRVTDRCGGVQPKVVGDIGERKVLGDSRRNERHGHGKV